MNSQKKRSPSLKKICLALNLDNLSPVLLVAGLILIERLRHITADRRVRGVKSDNDAS